MTSVQGLDIVKNLSFRIQLFSMIAPGAAKYLDFWEKGFQISWLTRTKVPAKIRNLAFNF